MKRRWPTHTLDIVVVNARAGSRYGHCDYLNAGCGMGYEATLYLLERGVRLTGADAWSWDAPRINHQLLCAQDPRCLGWLEARRGDL